MKSIPLSGGRGIGWFAIVDDGDYERLSKHAWNLDKDGYARGRINNRNVFMHHLILPDCPPGLERDHINRDKLDNRRENLRIVTVLENHLNVGLRRNNTSGETGVHWNRNEGRWQVRVSRGNKRWHLGYFSNIEDAARVRQEFIQVWARLKLPGAGELPRYTGPTSCECSMAEDVTGD